MKKGTNKKVMILTERTRLRRLPKRGLYDRRTIYQILDEGLVCHVGFVVNGRPVVIPTLYGRAGNNLYLHGSAASRMLTTLSAGVDVCITITLIDGLVLARSAFHHSMNYRSVVVFGRASVVRDAAKKMRALRLFSERLVPGRWKEARMPNAQEMKATLVLSVPLDEASAKVRTGPPLDDEADYSLPVWAGVLPLRLVPGTPVADPRLAAEIELPAYVSTYARRVG